MKRVLLAVLLLAASATPVFATDDEPVVILKPTIDTFSCVRDGQGIILIRGLQPGQQAIIEPGGERVYDKDGRYAIPPGDYIAYVVVPGEEVLLEQPFTIRDCQAEVGEPATATAPPAPLPTLPPTDTEAHAKAGLAKLTLFDWVVMLIVGLFSGAALTLALRRQP